MVKTMRSRNQTNPWRGNGSVTEVNHDPSYDWRSSHHSLKKRFEYIFNNNLLCDVNFVVGKDQKRKISASKFILSAGSLVFQTMFNGKWQESDIIKVPDIEPDIFSELLRFLYLDEASVNDDTAFPLVYASKKYAIVGLENQCTQFLAENLCPTNAFYYLEQARFFDVPNLVSSCLEVIDYNTVSAIATSGFYDIDNKTLCLVLARDTLQIKEIYLFEAVVRWSKAECRRRNLAVNPENQKSVLHGALSLIRYPVMSPGEFANKVADTDLLSQEEQLSLSLYFMKNPKPSICFNTSPRLRYIVLNRFRSVQNEWVCQGHTYFLRFYSSCDAQLVGVGLYGPIDREAEYSVNLSVFDITSDGDYPLHRHIATHITDKRIFRILFKLPVALEKDRIYVIKLSMKGPNSLCGVRGLKSFSQRYADGAREVTINIVDDNRKGQIPELLIR